MNSEAKCTLLPNHSLIICGILGKSHTTSKAAEAAEGVIACHVWGGCLGSAEDCIAVHCPNSLSCADTAR